MSLTVGLTGWKLIGLQEILIQIGSITCCIDVTFLYIPLQKYLHFNSAAETIYSLKVKDFRAKFCYKLSNGSFKPSVMLF